MNGAAPSSAEPAARRRSEGEVSANNQTVNGTAASTIGKRDNAAQPSVAARTHGRRWPYHSAKNSSANMAPATCAYIQTAPNDVHHHKTVPAPKKAIVALRTSGATAM